MLIPFAHLSYKKDPWLWSLDWTVQELSLKKEKVKKTTKKSKKMDANDCQKDDEVLNISSKLRNLSADELIDEEILDWYPDLPKADDVLYKRRQHMNGFPRFYLLYFFLYIILHLIQFDHHHHHQNDILQPLRVDTNVCTFYILQLLSLLIWSLHRL